MKKLILIATLATALFPIGSVHARIFGRRWSRPAYPTYSYSAPTQQYATAPMTDAAGYRAYSYQPGPNQPAPPNPNEPAEFQEFNPAYGYPTQQFRNETGEPYHDAGFKIRGF